MLLIPYVDETLVLDEEAKAHNKEMYTMQGNPSTNDLDIKHVGERKLAEGMRDAADAGYNVKYTPCRSEKKSKLVYLALCTIQPCSKLPHFHPQEPAVGGARGSMERSGEHKPSNWKECKELTTANCPARHGHKSRQTRSDPASPEAKHLTYLEMSKIVIDEKKRQLLPSITEEHGELDIKLPALDRVTQDKKMLQDEKRALAAIELCIPARPLWTMPAPPLAVARPIPPAPRCALPPPPHPCAPIPPPPCIPPIPPRPANFPRELPGAALPLSPDVLVRAAHAVYHVAGVPPGFPAPPVGPGDRLIAEKRDRADAYRAAIKPGFIFTRGNSTSHETWCYRIVRLFFKERKSIINVTGGLYPISQQFKCKPAQLGELTWWWGKFHVLWGSNDEHWTDLPTTAGYTMMARVWVFHSLVDHIVTSGYLGYAQPLDKDYQAKDYFFERLRTVVTQHPNYDWFLSFPDEFCNSIIMGLNKHIFMYIMQKAGMPVLGHTPDFFRRGDLHMGFIDATSLCD
jgi:hypothetical protein